MITLYTTYPHKTEKQSFGKQKSYLQVQKKWIFFLQDGNLPLGASSWVRPMVGRQLHIVTDGHATIVKGAGFKTTVTTSLPFPYESTLCNPFS